MNRRGWAFLGLGIVSLSTAFVFNACQSTINMGNNNADNVSCSSLAQPTCPSGSNVMPVSVGPQSVCGQNGYVNEPCVTVTICTHGGSPTHCDTISNILLDTGSYGLRVYNSLLINSAPAVVKSGSDVVTECAQFGTGAEWGPVATADVFLAGEPVASNVPIQLIEPTFGNANYNSTGTGPANTNCSGQTLQPNPQNDGFNGILGVGVFKQDCGADCQAQAEGQYYACVGTNCGNNGANSPTTGCGNGQGQTPCGIDGIALSLTDQVSNPIAFIGGGGSGFDNNGLALRLPDPGANGAANLTGCAILGVATQANNTPSAGAVAYPADGNGNFVVTYDGTQYSSSFIDSGSNGIFFVAGSDISSCSSGSEAPGFYCPSPGVLQAATNQGYAGSPSGSACFAVSNAESLIDTGNLAFDNLAGEATGYFDWGLPFFMGRTVYVGIQGQTKTINTVAPFWAY